METSKIRMALAIGILLSHALAAQRPPIHVAVGLGPFLGDQAEGVLSKTGFSSYLRGTFRPERGFAPSLELWFVRQSTGSFETPPCPPAGPCGGGPSVTTALVLAPILQASEHYERVTLVYRLGPTADWLVERAPGTSAVVAGALAGLTIRTSRGAAGLLFSVDYLRAFRGAQRPRWFLPITVGWQI